MSATFQTAYKYQFDKTGAATANLIADEEHTVVAGEQEYPIVLKEGAFYTKSVVITDTATATALVLGVDYTFAVLEEFITAETGIEAACAIKLLNLTYTGTMEVTYQACGGPQGQGNSLIQDLIDAIATAKATTGVSWVDIKAKPAAFPPALHTHAPDDLTGLEGLKQSLDDITSALTAARPLVDSSQNLQEQIDKLLSIAMWQRNAINDIVMTTGTGTQIAELAASIQNLKSVTDKEVSGLAIGAITVLGTFPLAEYNAVRGGVMYLSDTGEIHTEELTVTTNGTDIQQTLYGTSISLSPLFVITTAIVGTDIQVSASSLVAGSLKAKWYYAF